MQEPFTDIDTEKGYDPLGDAFTTLPSEQPRPQSPNTHIPLGGGFGSPQAPQRTGGALAPLRARACARARRALPGAGTPDGRAFLVARTRGWLFPA